MEPVLGFAKEAGDNGHFQHAVTPPVLFSANMRCR
jgi:hypothetical protein